MTKAEVVIPVAMMGESEQVLDKYRELVASGKCAPKLAEILASRKCPTADTDTAHYAGMKNLYETAGPSYANKIHKEAARHGLQVSKDMHFNGSIADSRGGGDPAAWMRVGDGRSHFKKVVESRGELSTDLGVTDVGRAKEAIEKKTAAFNKRKQAKEARQAEIADKYSKG